MATHVALTFLSALGLNAVVARAHARALRGDGVETEHSGPEEGKALRGLRGGLEAALGEAPVGARLREVPVPCGCAATEGPPAGMPGTSVMGSDVRPAEPDRLALLYFVNDVHDLQERSAAGDGGAAPAGNGRSAGEELARVCAVCRSLGLEAVPVRGMAVFHPDGRKTALWIPVYSEARHDSPESVRKRAETSQVHMSHYARFRWAEKLFNFSFEHVQLLLQRILAKSGVRVGGGDWRPAGRGGGAAGERGGRAEASMAPAAIPAHASALRLRDFRDCASVALSCPAIRRFFATRLGREDVRHNLRLLLADGPWLDRDAVLSRARGRGDSAEHTVGASLAPLLLTVDDSMARWFASALFRSDRVDLLVDNPCFSAADGPLQAKFEKRLLRSVVSVEFRLPAGADAGTDALARDLALSAEGLVGLTREKSRKLKDELEKRGMWGPQAGREYWVGEDVHASGSGYVRDVEALRDAVDAAGGAGQGAGGEFALPACGGVLREFALPACVKHYGSSRIQIFPVGADAPCRAGAAGEGAAGDWGGADWAWEEFVRPIFMRENRGIVETEYFVRCTEAGRKQVQVHEQRLDAGYLPVPSERLDGSTLSPGGAEVGHMLERLFFALPEANVAKRIFDVNMITVDTPGAIGPRSATVVTVIFERVR